MSYPFPGGDFVINRKQLLPPKTEKELFDTTAQIAKLMEDLRPGEVELVLTQVWELLQPPFIMGRPQG